MDKEPTPLMVSVDRIDGDTIVVELSDGTEAVATLEQFLTVATITPPSPPEE